MFVLLAALYTGFALAAPVEIRDDIATYIASHYTKPPQRAAAVQMAKAFQQSLVVDTQNMEAVRAVDKQIARGIQCMYQRFDGKDHTPSAAQAVQELESLSTNTKTRLLAYLKYNKALDGTASAHPEGLVCD